MRPIKKSYLIKAPIEEVWQALVNPKYIEGWGAGPAKMDDKVGTKFSMWRNQIHGKNLEVIPLEKLRQEWWGGRWDEPSITTFTLKKERGKTRIELTQENVPAEKKKELDKGWDEYYLGPMKEYLEKK